MQRVLWWAWVVAGLWPQWGMAQETATADLMAQSQDLCAAFHVEECVQLNQRLLERPDLSSAQRAQVYQRLAEATAVIGDLPESERYWRLVLRLDPALDLPEDTSPKILLVFRGVQAEERQLRTTLAAEERRRLQDSITLLPRLPARHQGGQALTIPVQLHDPHHGVAAVFLRHRVGTGAYGSVPCVQHAGVLEASIPAAQTAADAPRVMELFVEAVDDSGTPLKSAYTAESPFQLAVAPGQVPSAPLWRQPSVWAVTGGVLAGAAGLVVLGIVAAGVGGVGVAYVGSQQAPRVGLGWQAL